MMILESTQRIKNLIREKYKTKKTENDYNTIQTSKKSDDVFRNQFKKPIKKKFTKTQKRSKIKQKVMDNQTLTKFFMNYKLTSKKK